MDKQNLWKSACGNVRLTFFRQTLTLVNVRQYWEISFCHNIAWFILSTWEQSTWFHPLLANPKWQKRGVVWCRVYPESIPALFFFNIQKWLFINTIFDKNQEVCDLRSVGSLFITYLSQCILLAFFFLLWSRCVHILLWPFSHLGE